MSRADRLSVAALAVAFVLGLIIVSRGSSTPTPHPAVGRQRLGVPAYFGPGEEWARVSGLGAGTLAIVNPASGPGSGPRPDLAEAVVAARANGVQVIGYVDTGFGSRSEEVVGAELGRYSEWYQLDGVFFDQVSSDCGLADLYARLVSIAKVRYRALITVMNYGTNPQECYAEVGDIALVFEGSADEYASWKPANWQWRYPADRFWHLVYDTAGARHSEVIARSKRSHAGFIYVTDHALPNPWGGLPPPQEWSSMVAAARAGSAAADL